MELSAERCTTTRRTEVLFDKFKVELKKRIGDFTVDSPECCTHFVRTSTFAAIEVLKEKIRVEFVLNRFMENKRIGKSVKMSANHYVYYVDIKTEEEIDPELLEWVAEAYHLNHHLSNQTGVELPA